MLLNNKTLFVTGAGRGIGREIVNAALREGAKVIAHIGRRAADSGSDNPFDSDNVLCLYGDLAQQSDIDRLWAEAVAWRGRVDVLVNNAGIYATSALDNFADWEAGWKTN